MGSGIPPQGQGDARGSADARSSTEACLSWQKVQGRERSAVCCWCCWSTTRCPSEELCGLNSRSVVQRVVCGPTRTRGAFHDSSSRTHRTPVSGQ